MTGTDAGFQAGLGSLTSTSFTYSGTTYTVSWLTVSAGLIPQLSIALSGTVPSTSEAKLHLDLDGTRFSFADAVRLGSIYSWSNPALSWNDNDSVAVKLIEYVKPSAPRELVAQGDGESYIVLNWKPPTVTGGVDTLEYKIELSTDNGNTWAHLGTETTSSTDPLINHIDWQSSHLCELRTYRVSASNVAGTGPASATVSLRPRGDPPGAPVVASRSRELWSSTISVVASSDGTTWGFNSLTSGPFGVSSDSTFEFDDSTRTVRRLVTYGSGSGTYLNVSPTIQNIPGATLHIGNKRFDFENAEAAGEVFTWSGETAKWCPGDTVSVKLTQPKKPSAPRELVAQGDGESYIVLNWKPPTVTGGVDTLEYKIELSTDNGNTWAHLGTETTSSTDPLINHIDWQSSHLCELRTYRVSASNVAGTGPASATVSLRPRGDPPGAPVVASRSRELWSSTISVVASSDGTTWGFNSLTSGPFGVSSDSTFEFDDSTRTVRRLVTYGSGSGTYLNVSPTIQNIPGATLHIGNKRFDFENAEAAGEVFTWSGETAKWCPGDTVSVKLTQPKKPSAPRELVAQGDGESYIVLNWKPPTVTGGVDTLEYKIELSTDNGNTWAHLGTETTSSTDPLINHIDWQSSHLCELRTYRVSASNVAGTGPASATVSLRPRGDPPGAPVVASRSRELWSSTISVVASSDGTTWGFNSLTSGPFGVSSDSTFEFDDSTRTVRRLVTYGSGSGTYLNVSPTIQNIPGATLHIGNKRFDFENAEAAGEVFTWSGETAKWCPGDTVSVKLTQPKKPSAPRELVAQGDGESYIVLNWKPPTVTGGVDTLEYKIELSTDNGNTWAHLGTETTSSTDPLINHIDWQSSHLCELRTYRVSASNVAGTGPASATVSLRPRGDPPGAPVVASRSRELWSSTISVVASSDGTTWGFNSLSSGPFGASSDSTFEFDDSTRTVRRLVTYGSGSGTYLNVSPTIQNIPGATLHIGNKRFDFENAEAAGEVFTWSGETAKWCPGDTVSVKLTQLKKPSAPRNLKAKAVSTTQINLAWNVPTHAGSSAITGYKIEVSTDGGSAWSDLVANTRSNHVWYSHTGLAKGNKRTYRVSAINSAGTGQPSGTVSAAIAVPGAPPHLRLTEQDTKAILSWGRPSTNGSNAITKFQVRHAPGPSIPSGTTWNDVGGESTSSRRNTAGGPEAHMYRTHTVDELTNDQEYTFQIRVVNGVGKSPHSTVAGMPAFIADLTYRFNINTSHIKRGLTKQTCRNKSCLDAKASGYVGVAGDNDPDTLQGSETVQVDTTFTITWNGQPTDELHPNNPTTVTIKAGQRGARFRLYAAADNDNPKVYNKPVTADVVVALGDIRLRDPLVVIDDDPLPTASVSVPETVEEGHSFRVTATLSHALDVATSIPWVVHNPSEMEFSQMPMSRHIDIPAGALTAESGEIRKRNDNEEDGYGDLHFSINGISPYQWRGSSDTHRVRVTDDDTDRPNLRRYAGWPRLYVGDVNATESGDPGTVTKMKFPVTLYPTSRDTVTVDYRTEDGSARAGVNYVATSGTLTFAPREKTKTVEVDVLDDGVGQHRSFRLVLTGPRGGGAEVGTYSVTGRIYDETPTFYSYDESAHESGSGAGTAMTFLVKLNKYGAGNATYTVDYATADGTARAGSDYTATSGTLTFAPGERSYQEVTVPILDDSIRDSGETFSLVLSNPSQGAQVHASKSRVTGTILNDDTEGLGASLASSRFTSASHSGADDRARVIVAFSDAVSGIAADTPSVEVTGATVSSVQAHTEAGIENAWAFVLAPEGIGDVTFTMVADAACASGGICTGGGTVLTQVPAALTIRYNDRKRKAAALTGFTLVDAGASTDLMALVEGVTVRLGDLLAPSYGVRAEMGPGAAPGSVQFALSGAKTLTHTDDAAPWSLYGDGAGRVNGASLPPGSYTLGATTYADSGGQGEELGSLEVSFTVAAGALGVTTPGPFTVVEGATAVAVLGASQTDSGEAASWSIPAGTAGGADGAAFALTAEGVLSLVAAKDFEAPDDADGDGTYEVTVEVRAGDQSATAALSVTLTDVYEAPLEVTTPGPFAVAEGETAVATLAASDTGSGGAASWSIPAGTAGGADGAAFALTAEGVLSLVAAKDFEAPDDADGDGVWEVTVEAAVAAGARSATAALLVTLTDVNEAPVAQASASPARVREGVEVTLDGRESTDPDAGDTLSHAWTQDEDGAPRVVLSNAAAAQPVFTSPSDLAAETELGFTLKVTDAAGLHAEDTVTVTVTLISEVSIAAASDYGAEGAEAVFRLSRAGSALKALTVPVTVEETGAMLSADVPADATFAAGERETELRLPTAADAVAENDSLVTVRLASGPGWQLAADAASASLTVLDDDAAAVTGVSAADVTIWSADMTVVEYGPRSIGAGTAAQFSNQQGRAGLRAKWLWYDPVARTLKLGFDDSLNDAEALTLHVGAKSLGFPANSGGDSSFSLENVDVSWSDGETLAVRVSKPSAEALSTDATLASLSVDGATLSPAFDAAVLVYRAVADAETQTVTVSATATDGGASLAYGPAEDADTELADHQAAVPGEGEALVEVTVTAVDGTVRRYRVVVARAAVVDRVAPVLAGAAVNGALLTLTYSEALDADSKPAAGAFTVTVAGNARTVDAVALSGSAVKLTLASAVVADETVTVGYTPPTGTGASPLQDAAGNDAASFTGEAAANDTPASNTAPSGLPEIAGTAQVGETLTASADAITDADGLGNASFAWQWLANDGTEDTEIAGATGATHEVAPQQAGQTLKVRVAYTDDKGTAETLTSAATEPVAATVPSPPAGLAVTTAEGREGELSVSWSAPESDGGSEVSGYKVQWKSGTESYDGSESSAPQAVLGDAAASHTIAGLVNGTAYTVRVLAVNAAGAGAAAEVEATVRDRVAPVLAGAVVDGTALTLTFSEALDADSKPAAGAFTVTVAGNARTVDAVALSGSAVALTLAAAVVADETVTVGYTPPTGTGASPLQDAAGNDTASFTGEAAANDTPAANTKPSGLPAITGTAQVGEVLTASADAITDADGLGNASFAWQWLANDGTDDTDIAGATGATHEVTPQQAGQTLKVRVTFTDDKGTAETLVSAATEPVAAVAPSAPVGLAVATAEGRERELSASWSAPQSDGGSEVTGYKVQWKSGTESYDSSESSARQAVLGATAASHTIAGLVNGTAYTVRVLAVNAAGNGAAAEVEATATDRVAPVLTGAVVDGTALTLTFSEALDADSKPAAGAFAVSVQGNARTVDAVALSGSAVALTLAAAVVADETVTIGYTAPTGTGASPLQDASGNAVAGFSGAAVSNDTPAGNAKPNGLPAITGTAQVGEVLTASADAITDADGLDNATFAWQWLANDGTEDTEIAGATGATHEVAPQQAGQTLKVRVTFTDDKGTEETLVSAATEVVTVPLTAAFENVPPAHDGSSIFTFRVRFSESPAVSYKVLRDESFAVTGGSVDKARRVDGRNDLREIHVQPAGKGEVTLTLVGGRPCGTYGAICTADGRKLSNTPSATVQGPPALNVADARAVEGQDASLDFVVTLSRAAPWTVSVDYATADGSAAAGEDYSATSGTLTFNAGETTKTVSVALLDDVVDEGEETLTLTLSNPSGAWIEDGEASGTIENSDPLPVGWTARFGRSVATHLLDALEARLDTTPQSYVRLGGHQLGGAPDVKEAVERLAPPDQVRGRLDNNLSLWEEGAADSASQDMTIRDLLLGSAFNLVSNDDEPAAGPRLSAWGRVATSGFDGQQDRLSLNGTVTTATLGVDGVWKHWLTGVALAYSEGDGSFTDVEAEGGDLASTLTSVHPYAAYALSDRVRLWGMVGYGSGSLQLRLAEQEAMDTDLAMTMGALGIRGSLLEPSRQEGGMQLAVRSDVLWLRMDSAAVAGMAATEAEVSRLRLVLEGSRPISLASGGLLIPTLEVGLRHDGGDAETGSGVEVGGSLRYTSAWGLSVEASVRGLLAHEASDYQEWGASGALRFDPGRQGLGLTASIVPTWGSAASGVDRLWGQPQASGLALGHPLATAAAGRLDAELGYGLAALRGRGLLTPYVRAALAEGSEQAWHLGARLALARSLNLSLEASRRARDGDAAAHELALLATLGW